MRTGLCCHIQPAQLGGMDHFNRGGSADVHKMQPAAGTLTVQQRPGHCLKLGYRRPGRREIPRPGPAAADSIRRQHSRNVFALRMQGENAAERSDLLHPQR
ncbi:hypothetical protein D3C75_1222130 [compost metagenome]